MIRSIRNQPNTFMNGIKSSGFPVGGKIIGSTNPNNVRVAITAGKITRDTPINKKISPLFFLFKLKSPVKQMTERLK